MKKYVRLSPRTTYAHGVIAQYGDIWEIIDTHYDTKPSYFHTKKAQQYLVPFRDGNHQNYGAMWMDAVDDQNFDNNEIPFHLAKQAI